MFSVIINKIIQLAQLSKKQLHNMVVNDNVENDLFYKIFNDWFGKLFKNKEQIYQQLKGIKATKEHASALMNYGQLLNIIFQNNEDINDIIDLWNNPNDIIILELLCKIDPNQQFNVDQCKKLIKRIYGGQLGENIPRGPYNSNYLKIIKENISKLENIVNNNDNTIVVNLLNNLTEDAINSLYVADGDKDILGNSIIPKHIIDNLNNISKEKLEEIKDKRDSYSVNFMNWIRLLKNSIFDNKVSLYDIYLWGYYNPDYFWNLVKSNNINKLREETLLWCRKTLAQDSEMVKIYREGPIKEWTNGKDINDPEYIRCVNLNTSLDLVIESQKMNHCAGTMHQIQTEQGKEFFYSFRDKNNNVLATLDIEPIEQEYNEFKISEIRGFNNAVPKTFPSFVQNAIREWIEEHEIIESDNLDFQMERISDKQVQSQIIKAKKIAQEENDPSLLSELIANKYITKETDQVSFYAVVLSAIANGKGHELIFNHIVNEDDGDLYNIIVYGLENVGIIKRKFIQGLIYLVNKVYPNMLENFNVNSLYSGMIKNNEPLEINGIEIFQVSHGLILFGIIKPGNKYFDFIYNDMLRSSIEPREQVMILSNSAIKRDKPYTDYYYGLMDKWIEDDDMLVNDLILNGVITRLDGKDRYEYYLGMSNGSVPRVRSYPTKKDLGEVIEAKYFSRYDDVINVPDNVLSRSYEASIRYVQYRKNLSDYDYVDKFVKKNIFNEKMMFHVILNKIIDENDSNFNSALNTVCLDPEFSYRLVTYNFIKLNEENEKKLVYSTIKEPNFCNNLLGYFKQDSPYYEDILKSALLSSKDRIGYTLHNIVAENKVDLNGPYADMVMEKVSDNIYASFRLIKENFIDFRSKYFNALFNCVLKDADKAFDVFRHVTKLTEEQKKRFFDSVKNDTEYAKKLLDGGYVTKHNTELYNELMRSAIKDPYTGLRYLETFKITKTDEFFNDAIKNIINSDSDYHPYRLISTKIVDSDSAFYFPIITELIKSRKSAYDLISGYHLQYENVDQENENKEKIEYNNKLYDEALRNAIEDPSSAYILYERGFVNKNSPYFKLVIDSMKQKPETERNLVIKNMIDENDPHYNVIMDKNIENIDYVYQILKRNNVSNINKIYYERAIKFLLKYPGMCAQALRDGVIIKSNPYYLNVCVKAIEYTTGITYSLDDDVIYQILMNADFKDGTDLRNILYRIVNESDLSNQQKQDIVNKYPQYQEVFRRSAWEAKIINKIIKLSLR